MEIEFSVAGTPAPQGSKKVFNGHVVEASKNVKPWRQDVKHAALNVIGSQAQILTPVAVNIRFMMKRPKSHYRNNGTLKATAPLFHSLTPDLDKLVRSTMDAITETGIWKDDEQVVKIHAMKFYSNDTFIGAHIIISDKILL